MSIKINNFGGPIVWFLRKHYSGFTSRVMLKYAQAFYSKDSGRYTEWFLSQKIAPLPLNIMLETINRCNGKCAFCPANSRDERREFKKMTDEMFQKIVRQLKDMGWKGTLFMCVNNEPFIDKRIVEFSKYAKKELHGIRIAVITNGTLLNEDLMDQMVGTIDQITINDYSERYVFAESNRRIIKHIKKNPNKFGNIQITFNRRYTKEILATRAGSAPNKPKKNVDVTSPCLYPFTDLIIFPDGKVGMCCNDCYEITDLGNVMSESILEIWGGERFKEIRKQLQYGRNHPFCKECDVLDTGMREKKIKKY